MKEAVVIRGGGNTLSAEDADYGDFFKYLLCPECGQVVFLRKEHIRKGYKVSAAYVHLPLPSDLPEQLAIKLANCSYRTSGNCCSVAVVQKYNQESRGQKINKIKLSFWKYLKGNRFFSLSNSSDFRKEAKLDSIKGIVDTLYNDFRASWAENVPKYIGFISDRILEEENFMGVLLYTTDYMNEFLEKRWHQWHLHTKYAIDAAHLLVGDPNFWEYLYWLLCVFCNPILIMKFCPSFFKETVSEYSPPDMAQRKFGELYVFSLSFIAGVLLTTDWIGYLDEGVKPVAYGVDRVYRFNVNGETEKYFLGRELDRYLQNSKKSRFEVDDLTIARLLNQVVWR